MKIRLISKGNVQFKEKLSRYTISMCIINITEINYKPASIQMRKSIEQMRNKTKAICAHTEWRNKENKFTLLFYLFIAKLVLINVFSSVLLNRLSKLRKIAFYSNWTRFELISQADFYYLTLTENYLASLV